jgi:predicted metal-dependent phosphoesterase TrpH
MKLDLHLHTTRYSPDSHMEPLAMLRRAREVGLDGVVITEHDCLWTEAELDVLRAMGDGLVVMSGIEVSAREGHVLVYGVTNPFALPRGIGMAELCREVHRQGGAAVAAHPFRWGQPIDHILKSERPELDGLELMSSNMDAEMRSRAAALAAQLRLAGLGNSDAHDEDALGVCYTEFPDTAGTPAGLVAAIRERRTVPCQRDGQ